MAIDTLVKDLTLIRNPNEVDDIIRRMIAFENEKREESVILLIQNPQIGAIYRIKTKSEAEYSINGPRQSEWGVEKYNKKYMEDLKKRLKNIGSPRQRGIIPRNKLFEKNNNQKYL